MMCHSEETTSRSYLLQEKAKNVSKTFTKLQDTLRSEKNLELDLREVFKDDTSSSKSITVDTVRNKRSNLINVPLSDTQIRDKLRYMQSKKRRVEPHEVDEEEFISPTDQEDCSDPESSDELVTRRSRVKYSQDEEELIKKHFEKFNFNEQALITKKTILKVLDTNSKLRELKKKYGVQRLLVKLGPRKPNKKIK